MKRVLLDHNVSHDFTRFLRAPNEHRKYLIAEAKERGWERIRNGDLLSEAEAASFDVLVTADKSMIYQQNLTGRKLALVVLEQGKWSLIEAYVERVLAAMDAATPGSFAFVEIPLPPKKPYRQ